ncbi:hypothetical protein FOMA001_g16431 [Fusarium oxysporum f. sp. matthiolae]|nr:hypothetical protein FOMA001_g16431 [Fusarium oxysporum f. sp. matthiolae]
MRLINVEDLKLETFIGGQIPPYAILSHRWGNDDEEVTFKDMTRGTTEKVGMTKVKGCCRQAKKDNLKYAWIDTCCIDKESSKELDEAINSMFQWYRRADVCYTYMADVPHEQDIWESTSSFSTSSWFTRGWTLQELLAPGEIHFFDETWNPIGTKEDLASEIENITGIARKFLLGWVDFHQASVAQRMSWASKRKTKREEDIAYCLLGIFNVTMPMIYGEGHKAFERLQLKIMEQTTDDSIFAWGVKVQGMESESQTSPREDNMSAGIFASSPADFAKCGRIVPKAPDPACINTFAVSGGYIHTSLKLRSSLNGVTYGLLNCGLENTTDGIIAIPLHCTTPSVVNIREYIRPLGYGPILLSGWRTDYRDGQEVRIRVNRQTRPTKITGRRFWLHIDGHQKLKLHLQEIWPPFSWDRGRAFVTEIDDINRNFRRKHLARFTTRAERGSDIIVVLDFSIDTVKECADCFVIAAPESLDLSMINASLEYMQPEHLQDKVIDIGNVIVKVSVEIEDIPQGSIFLMRMARTDEKPRTIVDPCHHISKAAEMYMFISSLCQAEIAEDTMKEVIDGQATPSKLWLSLKDELDAVAEKQRLLAEERARIECEMRTAKDRVQQFESTIEEARKRLKELEDQTAGHAKNLEEMDGADGSANWVETLIQNQLNKQKAPRNTEIPVSAGPSLLPTRLINNQQSMGGYIPLLWAAANGKKRILRALIDRGADLEVRNTDNSYTALIYAAAYGRVSAASLLLKKGAMIEARDKDGDSALMVAAHEAHASVASLLIDRGADMEARNTFGNTPLSIAARRGRDAVVKALLEKGADIEAKNQWGDTPLSRACIYGRVGVARMLIDEGAKVDVKNKKGVTPLQLAEKNGQTEVVDMLRAYLATKEEEGREPSQVLP